MWRENAFTWQLGCILLHQNHYLIYSVKMSCSWIIDKLDATHQSFTLVFLSFLRGTSRFQSYGDKNDLVIS